MADDLNVFGRMFSKSETGRKIIADDPERFKKGEDTGTLGYAAKSIGGAIIDPYGLASDSYHAATGIPTASEKREQANLINSQIQAYKESTELTRQALDEAKKQRETERRRIEEKQIRGLRNRSSRGGLMSQSSDSKLGGSSTLPNKLGTA